MGAGLTFLGASVSLAVNQEGKFVMMDEKGHGLVLSLVAVPRRGLWWVVL